MRKTRRPKVRIIDLPNEWFARSEDVLDTSIAGSYIYVEDRSNDSAGSKAGLIAGVVVGSFLAAFVLALLYIRRRANPQVRNWRFPKFNINTRFRLEKLRRRRSHGIKEMISITAPTEFSALQQEQQQLSPVHAYRPNTKSTQSSIISVVDTVSSSKLQPVLPQKDRAKLLESSWLSLTPDNLDEQIDVETAVRPSTARTSRVTIPSYYYHYYRKYFDRDNYRVPSQYYPESRLSSDLISYRDRSSRASINTKRGTSTRHKRTSTLSKPLVPDKSSIDNEKDPSESPIDQGSNLAYFEFDIHSPHNPKQAILPPPPPAAAARRSRRSMMDTYGSSQQQYYNQSRKKRNRQTASSIATVSTAPIFRQHPGEEVDLESMGRVGRVRSSLLNGLIVLAEDVGI